MQNNKAQGPLREVLFHCDAFEVVSIRWTNANHTELHNHGWSNCAVLIQEGLFENRLDLGLKTEVQQLEVGQIASTPIGARHHLVCLSETGKTLHVYTPKIKEHSESGTFKVEKSLLQDKISLQDPVQINELKKILDFIKEKSISTHSPYFMNQLFSGISPVTLLAEEVVAQSKTTLATHEASPIFSAIESEIIQKLADLIGWKQSEGISVPGGSAANFMALHCARHRAFPDAKKKGMDGSKIRVFVSSEAHYSFKKAALALGLGSENIQAIKVDKDGKMDAAALENSILEAKKSNVVPLMVAATAGTTVLGAFDPIEQIADVCERHSIWLHVDGAWGGPAIFSSKLKSLVKGLDRANSFTFDAHKLLAASLTCSFLITREKGVLLEANDVSGGDYLFHDQSNEIDRGRMSWQCGRRAEALSFWALWKNLGNEGFDTFVNRLVDIRSEAVEWIKTQERLSLLHDPEYLNICVRVQPHKNEIKNWSEIVRNELKAKDQAMVNFSSDENGPFLRLILAHPYLEVRHVKDILNWALEI